MCIFYAVICHFRGLLFKSRCACKLHKCAVAQFVSNHAALHMIAPIRNGKVDLIAGRKIIPCPEFVILIFARRSGFSVDRKSNAVRYDPLVLHHITDRRFAILQGNGGVGPKSNHDRFAQIV